MMTSDEARELFSEAFDDELDPERKASFEAALAADPQLREEYAQFVETFQLVGRIGELDDAETPDLLSGVQERLRKRSRGRYYRDRFSRRGGAGWLLPLLLAMMSALVLAMAWYVLHSTVVLEAAPSVDAQ